MIKNNTERVSKIVFYGALWGILEATLGYLLHFIPVPISGLVMFPLAAIILMKAYPTLGKRRDLFYIGCVAAAIKAMDLFLPGLPMIKTISPMVCMLLEALVVAAALPLLEKGFNWKVVVATLGTSLSWRTLFVAYNYGYFIISGNLAPYLASPVKVLEFVVISGFYSSLILMGLVLMNKLLFNRHVSKKVQLKPIYGMMMVLVALLVQYWI